MGRGFFLVLAVAFTWWFYPSDKAAPEGTEVTQEAPQSIPTHETTPAVRAPAQDSTPVMLKTPEKKTLVAQVPAEERGRSEREGFQQNNRRWNHLDGVVAVKASSGLPRLSELHGFHLVRTGDVPVGTETFAVVERDDNGILGVMTGVLKALGDRGEGEFLSSCPGEIVESYPALKSHLLRPAGEPEDFHACLAALNRFKRLEWEILDRPRGPK